MARCWSSSVTVCARSSFPRDGTGRTGGRRPKTWEVDDLADLLADLPETVTQQLLRNMDQQDRERLTRVLSWPEDTAGGLMSTDTVSVRSDVSPRGGAALPAHARGELPQRTDRLFVVDRSDRFLGTITLSRLLTDDPDNIVGASLDTEAPRIAPDTTASEVSQLFRDRRPGVRAGGRRNRGVLLGRITVDDVVDVITEEAAHEVMAGAGLRDEEDVFAPVLPPPAAAWCGWASIWSRPSWRAW